MKSEITVSGQHIEVTPALEAHAVKKLQKLDKRFNHIISVDVKLALDSNEHRAEGIVHVAGGRGPLIANAVTHDMYASIDMMADRLLTQVQKYKEKLADDEDGGLI